jgi:hypothetical protein
MSWRPIFVHEFLDRRLGNMQGEPGSLLSSVPPPIVRGGGTNIRPGVWFGYALSDHREDVIGIDVSYRVHAPVFRGALPLLNITGAMDVALQFSDPLVTEFVDGNLVAHAALLVRVGPQEIVWDNVQVPYRFPMTLRITWHTSGQLQLTIDGALAAYHPAVVPTAAFEVSSFAFGDPQWQGPTGDRFSLRGICLRILQEDDTIRDVLAEIPVELPPNLDGERCAVLVVAYQREIVRKYREFMRLFVSATTTAWQKTDQAPTPAFDAAANDAHRHALAALTHFMQYVRKGDESARAAYLNDVEQFFIQLNAQLPDELRALLDDIAAIPQPPRECLELARPFLEQNATSLDPIRQLSDETVTLARRVVDGGP